VHLYIIVDMICITLHRYFVGIGVNEFIWVLL
jgi:hypothetical protein